jgi:hypothetical protein
LGTRKETLGNWKDSFRTRKNSSGSLNNTIIVINIAISTSI